MQTLTIVLLKKDDLKTKISVAKVDNDDIEIDLSKDEKIEIPFLIKVTGNPPKVSQGITFKAKIKGLTDFDNDKAYKVVGAESIHTIKIKRSKNPDLYARILKQLENKTKVEIEITDITGENAEIDNSNKTLTFVLNKINKTDSRYYFFAGTNFDLKDSFKATSFYSDIEVILPNIIFKRWGIRAGIFKNNNSTSLEEIRFVDEIKEVTNTTNDSLTYVTKRVNSIPNVSIENLGLYFELLYNINRKDNSNFKLFASIHVETIERREKYTYNNTELLTLGEETISIEDLSNDDELKKQLSDPIDFTQKYNDSYFGISFPMIYQNSNKNFEVLLNPIYGFGDPGLQLNNEDKTKSFGAFQFYLIIGDKEHIGIKLGGEIRKYFNFQQEPIISINLSTKINLASLIGAE